MKRSTLLAFVATIFFTATSLVFAQDYTPLAPLPGTVTQSGTTDITTYLSGALKLIIALGGAIAILVAIVGGTQYVASGITPDAKSAAKDRITNAFIGLALVLTSYLILNSINPKLVQFSFGLPPVGVLPGAPGSGGSGEHTPTPLPPLPPTPTSTPVTPPPPPTPGGPATNTPPLGIDITNDYSIISHCIGNTTYSLCANTDLNNDGKTDVSDVTLFQTKGNILDVNQNRTIELANTTPAAARSCFYKVPTVNVHNLLPRYRRIGLGTPATYGTFCGGTGKTMPPNVACNGGAWVKFADLNAACAADSGLLTMPFGYVWGANGTSPGEGGINGQYSNFIIWVNGSRAGTAINLGTLFHKTFLAQVPPPQNVDPYLESNLGKVSYATIAQYDLNNDGLADLGLAGADMVVFNGCKTASFSGVCIQADFNNDGVVDDRDLGFANDLFTGPGIALGWKLDWFESRYFNMTGYDDKQIINYCLGRTAFEKCGFADVNSDRVVNSSDLTQFNTDAPLMDFNNDGVVNLR